MAEVDVHGTLRAMIEQLAAHDVACVRFGARVHRYRLAPPIAEAELAAIEAAHEVALPEEYRAHLRHVGNGGAGPYHGLWPVDHPAQRALLRGPFRFTEAWRPDRERMTPAEYADHFDDRHLRGTVGLAHLGCGYLSVLVVDGPARGTVWCDARGAGAGIAPTHASFQDWIVDWVRGVAQNALPVTPVPPGACAVPDAISRYLRSIEEKRGLAPGSLAGEPLAAALGAIADGGIATTADGSSAFFDEGDVLDLCSNCARMIENLLPHGMRRAQVRDGVPAKPQRG
jgi:hypothetical protein